SASEARVQCAVRVQTHQRKIRQRTAAERAPGYHDPFVALHGYGFRFIDAAEEIYRDFASRSERRIKLALGIVTSNREVSAAELGTRKTGCQYRSRLIESHACDLIRASLKVGNDPSVLAKAGIEASRHGVTQQREVFREPRVHYASSQNDTATRLKQQRVASI